MDRSRFKNKYLKSNTSENKRNYKKIRNYCVNLLRRSKKRYYNNLNTKDIMDNKRFWKTIKPLFTEKAKHTQNITLIEKNVLITEKENGAEKFNSFFINVVPELKITINDDNITNTDGMSDPVLKAIKRYENHPSILKIKENVKIDERFSFCKVYGEEVSSIFKKLDPSKAATHKNIPIKIFKQNIDISNQNVTTLINKMIEKSEFPDNLKMADVAKNGLFIKRIKGRTQATIGQSVYYRHYQKYSKNFYFNK